VLTCTALQSLLALFGEEYRLYVGFFVCEACGCLQLQLLCEHIQIALWRPLAA
jgi:hypothetical protein